LLRLVAIGRKEVVVSFVAAILLLAFSIYFFLVSVSLMSYPQPKVTASLLALIIGFVCLSGALNLFKATLYSRVASKEEEKT